MVGSNASAACDPCNPSPGPVGDTSTMSCGLSPCTISSLSTLFPHLFLPLQPCLEVLDVVGEAGDGGLEGLGSPVST